VEQRLRLRYWIALITAVIAAVLAVVTLAWRDWIEVVFAIDPDQGSGALEWLIVAACLTVSVTCGLLARYEYRRVMSSTA
jgi:hypothetical protein